MGGGQLCTIKILLNNKMYSWAVLSDEQMSNGCQFSLLNDEQMSNWLGVKHQPDSPGNSAGDLFGMVK